MKLNFLTFYWKGFIILTATIAFVFSSISLLFFLFALYLTLFIHEIGHALAAKRANITIEEISIGIGPKVITHKWFGTELHFRSLPFGGYNILEDKMEFKTTYGQKMLIASGGILANIAASIMSAIGFIIMWTLGGRAEGAMLDSIVSNLEQTSETINLTTNEMGELVLIGFLLLAGFNLSFGIFQMIPLFFFDGAKIIQYTINHIISKRRQENWNVENHLFGKVWAGASITLILMWLFYRYGFILFDLFNDVWNI